MNNFRIFTESKADVKFLKDYITSIFNRELEDGDFDTLGSWSGYKAGGSLSNSIKENTIDNGKISVLIIDADTNFSARLSEVTNDFQRYNVPVALFLFPNHSDNGNLESLLTEIAAERKLIDCFLKYEKCVNVYPKPLNDSRIYSYLDMLLHPDHKDEQGKDLRKEEYRNYQNKIHWDLFNPFLDPLKSFLQKLI